jgi:hypothetical protein
MNTLKSIGVFTIAGLITFSGCKKDDKESTTPTTGKVTR